jgi:t-SNARE complex subunit (syntaxin)
MRQLHRLTKDALIALVQEFEAEAGRLRAELTSAKQDFADMLELQRTTSRGLGAATERAARAEAAIGAQLLDAITLANDRSDTYKAALREVDDIRQKMKLVSTMPQMAELISQLENLCKGRLNHESEIQQQDDEG